MPWKTCRTRVWSGGNLASLEIWTKRAGSFVGMAKLESSQGFVRQELGYEEVGCIGYVEF